MLKNKSLEIDIAFEVCQLFGGVNTFLANQGKATTANIKRIMFGIDNSRTEKKLKNIRLISVSENLQALRGIWKEAKTEVFLFKNESIPNVDKFETVNTFGLVIQPWEYAAIEFLFHYLREYGKKYGIIRLNIHYPDTVGWLLINKRIKMFFPNYNIKIVKYLHSYNKGWENFTRKFLELNPHLRFKIDKKITTPYIKLEQFVIENCDVLYYMSETTGVELRFYNRQLQDKFHNFYLEHPLHLSRPKPNLLALNNKATLNIVFGSRLTKLVKGVELFPLLFEKLTKSKKRFNFELYLLTDEDVRTPYWQKWLSKINHHYPDISINLHFVNSDNHNEFLKVILAADVAVFPSMWESWGLTQQEVYESGLPMIISDRSGFAKYLEQYKQDTEGVYIYPATLDLHQDAEAIRDRIIMLRNLNN